MAKKKTTTPAAALKRAQEQLKRASEDPEDEANLFLWAFYALEKGGRTYSLLSGNVPYLLVPVLWAMSIANGIWQHVAICAADHSGLFQAFIDAITRVSGDVAR